jgi:hypothetical protein
MGTVKLTRKRHKKRGSHFKITNWIYMLKHPIHGITYKEKGQGLFQHGRKMRLPAAGSRVSM